MSLGALKAWEMIRGSILTDLYATVLKVWFCHVYVTADRHQWEYFCKLLLLAIIKEASH